jgi:hypothetical protein
MDFSPGEGTHINNERPTRKSFNKRDWTKSQPNQRGDGRADRILPRKLMPLPFSRRISIQRVPHLPTLGGGVVVVVPSAGFHGIHKGGRPGCAPSSWTRCWWAPCCSLCQCRRWIKRESLRGGVPNQSACSVSGSPSSHLFITAPYGSLLAVNEGYWLEYVIKSVKTNWNTCPKTALGTFCAVANPLPACDPLECPPGIPRSVTVLSAVGL